MAEWRVFIEAVADDRAPKPALDRFIQAMDEQHGTVGVAQDRVAYEVRFNVNAADAVTATKLGEGAFRMNARIAGIPHASIVRLEAVTVDELKRGHTPERS